MKTSKWIMTSLVLILALSLSMPALAGNPHNGDDGGKKGGGKSKGGSGFNAEGADQLPLTITFDDASGDRMKSDSALYVDSDIQGAPDANLAAHIFVGSSGNYGNLYLLTSNTVDRTVSMDISDCTADCGDQPFSSDSLPVALTVIATEAVSNGFCGMGDGDLIPGPYMITAPMEITYNLEGVEQPGFIYFNPGLKGKSPCRGAGTSNEVSVERVDDVTWRVMGSAACVVKPGGRDAGGQVNMPFGFTIDASATCN